MAALLLIGFTDDGRSSSALILASGTDGHRASASLSQGELGGPRTEFRLQQQRRRFEIMLLAGKIKKYFLIFASSTIFIVALLYGISPHWFAKTFLGVQVLDHNLAHIFRAMMCLYFGFGLFWLIAAFSRTYRNPALLTVMLFPAGLVIGRVISYFIDGPPSPLLFAYMVIEFTQAPLAYLVFKLPGD